MDLNSRPDPNQPEGPGSRKWNNVLPRASQFNFRGRTDPQGFDHLEGFLKNIKTVDNLIAGAAIILIMLWPSLAISQSLRKHFSRRRLQNLSRAPVFHQRQSRH